MQLSFPTRDAHLTAVLSLPMITVAGAGNAPAGVRIDLTDQLQRTPLQDVDLPIARPRPNVQKSLARIVGETDHRRGPDTIAGLGAGHVARDVDVESPGSRSGPLEKHLLQEGAVGPEHLNTIVGPITDVGQPIARDPDTMGRIPALRRRALE